MTSKKNLWMAATVLVTAAFLITVFSFRFSSHDMDSRRMNFISMKEDIQDTQRQQNDYRCCLEKPCTYCIEKTPGHGEGAACQCLEDIVNSVHPCGECIGEILEGHGNPYLAKYFAAAIAEEVGKEHIGMLRQIIAEKYGKPVEEQL